MLACLFPRCAGHDGRQLDEIQHSLQHLVAEIATVKRDQRALLTKVGLIMSDIHDEISEALQPVVDAVTAVSADVAQDLTDFANQIAPKLTDDEKAKFAGIAQSLLDLDATVKAADPGTPAVPTTPVDTTGDGSIPSA